MSKLLLTICAVFVFAACTKKSDETVQEISIIPKPATLVVKPEVMRLRKKISIVATSEGEKRIAGLLQEFFKERKIETSISQSPEGKEKIILSTINDPSLGDEGYKLSVGDNGILIEANKDAGLFYGTQSLLQIIPEEGDNIQYLEITDNPRFAYRGLHLDVGRNMYPPAFIKKYIDLMARHKFNRFHWHLTEDQGWRIEIKKYPKLQEIGAYRDETVVGRAGTKTKDKKYDGKRYGGYYTQEEVKDIVKYASERFVTVIPEIELPGHALAALAAYPNLGCTGGPYKVATAWGVFDDVYCAGKEDAYIFLEDVLDEVIELFPSKYIHIGGDECPKIKWEKCPHCKKRMKTEKLKTTHELQSYFIQRIEKHLNEKGRQIIGWDEILEGGLAPNATVMSWRGEEGGIAAAKQNHDVIMTPTNWCYLDYYQDTTSASEPLAIGGFVPVSKVYSYEPVPPQLTADEAKHILGAQCNVWTEYMKTPEQVEYMVYPRACAMAEVDWSQKENRSYEDFVRRMQTHVKRLARWKVNYAKHIEKEFPQAVAEKE
jgi:hexosaminidase